MAKIEIVAFGVIIPEKFVVVLLYGFEAKPVSSLIISSTREAFGLLRE
jgi:hypothetical protein